MLPEEARNQFPGAFDSDSVYEVVSDAVAAGEAALIVIGGDLIYHDPYFGEDCAVRDLRYNSELGMYREAGES